LAINDLLVALSVELHGIGNFVGSMSAADSENLGIAFALVCLAGLCAPLGACVVLFMKKSHVNLLAASIALAAGVMIFVSLTEVWQTNGST
jgi:ZIP family zinc transporter